MKQAALFSFIAFASLTAGGLAESVERAGGAERPLSVDTPAEATERVIELAICLDTSGSMDGLLNSARQKLWAIVNDLAKAEPTPTLRVALLSYGNDGHNQENGWVNVETPFTEDLDTVSQMLFGLTTNGGTELVGRVVQTSLQELDWRPSADTLRMIFVAGNESADQDEQVAARDICKEAAARGIDVNTIYCVFGGDDSEIRPGWRELARLGNGEFAMIDQDNGTSVIATPYDETLIRLSSELNETYIPFGAAGQAGCANQAAQDANAAQLNSANAASRAATKAGKLYSCGAWDLVDAIRNGEVILAEVDESDLPEDMRALSYAQRVAWVENKQRQRTKLQSQINELDESRQTLLAKELARQATTDVGSFDLAIRSAIRTKAEALGFTFSPLGATAASVAAPADESDTFDYFVRFAGGSMSTWVANDIVVDFEDARLHGKEFKHDVHIVPGSPEADAFIKTLPTHMRDLVRSVQGMVYLRWNDRVYLLTGGC